MAALRLPGLGPIVGHTTDTTSRVWVRADPETDGGDHPGAARRTMGVVGVLSKDGEPLDPVFTAYFRLRREFDRSGSINLGADTDLALEPDAEYEVRVGCLVLDDALDDDDEFESDELLRRLPHSSAWREDLARLDPAKAGAVVRTFPAEGRECGRVSFLLGSCRYPGLLWKVRHSDRIFAPMARLAEGLPCRRDRAASDTGDAPADALAPAEAHAPADAHTPADALAPEDRPRFVLMVGDQIYADLFNKIIPFGRADTYREFRDRYLTAFASPNVRRLMQRLPTYMILDDHEIEDNWSQDRLRRSAKYQLFTIAVDAYLSYQWSHGPRTWGRRLYYRFDCGGFPFFVLDTRTQRFVEGPKGDLTRNNLLGRPTLPGAPPGQLKRLLDWLDEQQRERGNVPKFVVSSGVFAPNPMSARTAMAENWPEALEESDGWPAFPATRAAILRRVVDAGIQNVVFLSGDIHCCNVAELFLTGTPEAERIKAFSVTSSAFYWPFPFADGEPSDFVHDSRADGQEDTFGFEDSQGRAVSMDYRAWNFSQEDNFSHLTVDRESAELRVRVYDRRGRPVKEEDGQGRKARLDARLELAPWQ